MDLVALTEFIVKSIVSDEEAVTIARTAYEYCTFLKLDGYATSSKYVSTLYNTIKKLDLECRSCGPSCSPFRGSFPSGILIVCSRARIGLYIARSPPSQLPLLNLMLFQMHVFRSLLQSFNRIFDRTTKEFCPISILSHDTIL